MGNLVGAKKLMISAIDGKQAGLIKGVEAMFNPKDYTVSKSVPWNPHPEAGGDAPELQFTTGQGRTLALELFFDTYEAGGSVRAFTKALDTFSLIDVELHRPPQVLVTWGSIAFRGVIESLNHRFTMFREDGTPVRATSTLSIREADSASKQDEDKGGKKSPDHAKVRTIKRGETLQSIAFAEYDDSSEWRRIADANGIDDPLRLEPGLKLLVPPILS